MLTRRQGHFAGAVGIGAAAACAARCVVSGVSGSAVAVGATALAVAYHLLTKLYLDDPEAVADYRRQIDAAPLAVALRTYSVDDVARMFGAEYLRGRIAQEAGSSSLARVCDTFGVGTVKDFIKVGAVTRDDARTMAGNDVRAAATFSALWRRFDGRLPSVWQLGVFEDTAALRQLLVIEFDWVDDAGSPRASTAPPSEVGSTMNAFKAALTYGAWAVEHLNVSHAFWRGALKCSPEGDSGTFTDLLNLGLKALHRAHLIDVEWAQRKFDAQARHWSLWHMDDAVDLRDCVHGGLLRVEQFESAFQRAIPTDPATATSHSKEANIVEFLKYFEPLLRRHAALVPPHLREPVWDVKTRVERAEAAYEAACDRARDAERAAIRAAENKAPKTAGHTHHHRPHDKEDGALQNARRDARRRRDEEEREAKRALAAEHARIHEAFALDASRCSRHDFALPTGLAAECRVQ